MENNIIYILIAINVIVSYIGFKNQQFFNQYKFDMQAILQRKQYYRLLTSSFLHADTVHLLFNMITLFFFKEVAQVFGIIPFLIIYFLAVLGGNFLTIIFHRKELFYTAVGASGGVSGIVFAIIALYPNIEIYVYFIKMFGWIYALLYLGYSIYGMKNNLGNIGHAAHLGGAIVGLLGALFFRFDEATSAKANIFIANVPSLAILAIPVLVLVFYIIQQRK